MKHLKQTVRHAFLAVLMLTFCIGCGSDDNGGGSASGLVGTWYLKTYNGHIAEDCDRLNNIVVTSNGRFTYESYMENPFTEDCDILDIPNSGNYTVNGNVISLVADIVPGMTFTPTYSISDGILTLEGDTPFPGGGGITTFGRNPE